MRLIPWVAALALPALAGAQTPTGDAILARVDANIGSDSKVTLARMVVEGRGVTRTVESRSWIRGMTESFTEYLAPPRDRGTKMLKLGDQLWTYLPESDRHDPHLGPHAAPVRDGIRPVGTEDLHGGPPASAPSTRQGSRASETTGTGHAGCSS